MPLRGKQILNIDPDDSPMLEYLQGILKREKDLYESKIHYLECLEFDLSMPNTDTKMIIKNLVSFIKAPIIEDLVKVKTEILKMKIKDKKR
jgi:hypothetical protein